MLISDEHFQGYDIIGDVHGCADTLRDLLAELGYQKSGDGYRYSNQAQPRQVIFVGDIVDRGPQIREALHLVREMVECGSARLVMGNHEFNALKYCTPDPTGDGYLRAHSERNTRLFAETLAQFANHGDELQEFCVWFLGLPIFLEFADFRVVHACWDADLIAEFRRLREGNTIDEAFLYAAARVGSFEHQFMDRLTRGVDLRLPNKAEILGSDGITRTKFRSKFWIEDPVYYDDLVFQPDPLPEQIATMLLSDEHRDELLHYDREQKPLFFGHYWRSGEPRVIRGNIVCLDYGSVKGGKLVAYRKDPGAELHNENFVWCQHRNR